MGVFNNQLYVGSSGWYNTLFPGSEMIVIYPDDTWDLVAGTPRTVNGVAKNPISGLPDGMGNPFNAHFWRMDDWANGLIVGTNDWSYILQDWPGIGRRCRPEFGFDVYGTCDGRSWFPLTINAFGAGIDNFGARTMVTAPDGTLYLGSANHAQGTTIFDSTIQRAVVSGRHAPDHGDHLDGERVDRGDGDGEPRDRRGGGDGDGEPSDRRRGNDGEPIGRHGGERGGGVGATGTAATPARPSELLTDVQACGTVVSWQPTPGAVRYKVLRCHAEGRQGARATAHPAGGRRRARHAAALHRQDGQDEDKRPTDGDRHDHQAVLHRPRRAGREHVQRHRRGSERFDLGPVERRARPLAVPAGDVRERLVGTAPGARHPHRGRRPRPPTPATRRC